MSYTFWNRFPTSLIHWRYKASSVIISWNMSHVTCKLLSKWQYFWVINKKVKKNTKNHPWDLTDCPLRKYKNLQFSSMDIMFMVQGSMLAPSTWKYVWKGTKWFRVSRVFGTLVISHLLTAFLLHHTHSELSETLDESVPYHYKIILLCRSLVGMKELMSVVSNFHTN
jgi:hypothetical protein